MLIPTVSSYEWTGSNVWWVPAAPTPTGRKLPLLGGRPHGQRGVPRERGEDMAQMLSPEEEMVLREGVKDGAASCPRCGKPLNITPIPPRSDVSYVRNRVLLECSRCYLRVALDRD